MAEEEEVPAVALREGLCQVEIVPFALVELRLLRTADWLVARVNDRDFFRTTDHVVDDELDLATKVALVEDTLHVHFGDKFESLERWQPAAGEEPEFNLDPAACPKSNDLLQGRFPNVTVDEDAAYRRHDLAFLRFRMIEQLASSLGSLAGATIGRRSAIVASAVQLEAGERDGTRVKPTLLEGHSNENTPYGKARLRYFGNTVQLFGAVYRTYSPDKTLAFELPEELRPNRAVELQVLLDPAVEESCEGMVFISPEGKVELLSLARFSVFNPAPEGQTFMLNGLSYEIKEEN